MNEILTTIIDFIRSDTLDKIIWLCSELAERTLDYIRYLIDGVIN